MPGDFPDVLSDEFVTVNDFTTDEIIACGRVSLRFIKHTDPLRVKRAGFTGEFRPDGPEDAQALERSLVGAFAAGNVSHNLQVEHGGKTWVLTVKFEPGDKVFPFSGRRDPRPVE